MELLELSGLELNKAGYLVSKATKKPVTHAAFVAEQNNAHFTVSLAEAIKGKTFKADKVADLNAIKAEVLAAINAKAVREFVPTPAKPTSKVNDEIVKYALDFDKYNDQKSEVAKINAIMAEFSTIDGVETVGDYFSEGLVKLNKIYSCAEILAAVQATAETLK